MQSTQIICSVLHIINRVITSSHQNELLPLCDEQFMWIKVLLCFVIYYRNQSNIICEFCWYDIALLLWWWKNIVRDNFLFLIVPKSRQCELIVYKLIMRSTSFAVSQSTIVYWFLLVQCHETDPNVAFITSSRNEILGKNWGLTLLDKVKSADYREFLSIKSLSLRLPERLSVYNSCAGIDKCPVKPIYSPKTL